MWYYIGYRAACGIALVFFLLMLKEIVSFIFRSWLAICVCYTMNDMYKKRRVVKKYYTIAKNYCMGLQKIIF
jgi:hypothetical protein